MNSLVATVFIHKAIGDKFRCIFINNGLLRKGGIEEVQMIFKDIYKIDLIYNNTSTNFLQNSVNIPLLAIYMVFNNFVCKKYH